MRSGRGTAGGGVGADAAMPAGLPLVRINGRPRWHGVMAGMSCGCRRRRWWYATARCGVVVQPLSDIGLPWGRIFRCATAWRTRRRRRRRRHLPLSQLRQGLCAWQRHRRPPSGRHRHGMRRRHSWEPDGDHRRRGRRRRRRSRRRFGQGAALKCTTAARDARHGVVGIVRRLHDRCSSGLGCQPARNSRKRVRRPRGVLKPPRLQTQSAGALHHSHGVVRGLRLVARCGRRAARLTATLRRAPKIPQSDLAESVAPSLPPWRQLLIDHLRRRPAAAGNSPARRVRLAQDFNMCSSTAAMRMADGAAPHAPNSCRGAARCGKTPLVLQHRASARLVPRHLAIGAPISPPVAICVLMPLPRTKKTSFEFAVLALMVVPAASPTTRRGGLVGHHVVFRWCGSCLAEEAAAGAMPPRSSGSASGCPDGMRVSDRVQAEFGQQALDAVDVAFALQELREQLGIRSCAGAEARLLVLGRIHAARRRRRIELGVGIFDGVGFARRLLLGAPRHAELAVGLCTLLLIAGHGFCQQLDLHFRTLRHARTLHCRLLRSRGHRQRQGRRCLLILLGCLAPKVVRVDGVAFLRLEPRVAPTGAVAPVREVMDARVGAGCRGALGKLLQRLRDIGKGLGLLRQGRRRRRRRRRRIRAALAGRGVALGVSERLGHLARAPVLQSCPGQLHVLAQALQVPSAGHPIVVRVACDLCEQFCDLGWRLRSSGFGGSVAIWRFALVA
mmetsp:Transcript_87284/g.252037  ORF Transcript_87284/g.252037 Transcript_87284/m.252037 type:complete len:729 (+) Transcript_87284:1-2187(+)